MKTRLEFGEWLRRHREKRGISLKALADQTKITASLYADLERGDCSRWPGGIYNRSWVRSYAVAIGLDADDVAQRFSRCFAETAFPEPQAAPKEHPVRKALRQLAGLFARATPQGDRQVPVHDGLVAANVSRENPKRVISRRKRRRVQRSVGRNAVA